MAGEFTPEQKGLLYEGADLVGSIFKQRYQAKQAEMFMANEYARFLADSSAIHDKVTNSYQDPNSDAMGLEFQQYQRNVFMPFITQATMKYIDNPAIMTLVQQTKESNTEGWKMFLDFQEADVAKRQVGAQERQVATGEATEARQLGGQPSQINLRDAQAEYQRALAAKATAETKSKEPLTFNDVYMRARSRKDLQEKLSVDTQTKDAIVARTSSKLKGTPRPSGDGLYGDDMTEEGQLKDKNAILDSLRQKGLLQEALVAGRVASELGTGEEVAQNLFAAGIRAEALGHVFPPGAVAPEGAVEEQLKQKLTDRSSGADTVSVITGTPQGRDPAWQDLEEYYDDQVDDMDSYKQLPPTLSRVFNQIQSDKLGNPVFKILDQRTGKVQSVNVSGRNSEEFKRNLRGHLTAQFRKLVTDNFVQAGTKKQNTVNVFTDKVIDKFIDELADEYMPPAITEKEKTLKAPSLFDEFVLFPNLKKKTAAVIKAREIPKNIKLLYEMNKNQ